MKPRGIRNNNPGNIRVGEAWHGEQEYGLLTEEQRGESAFEVFAHATYGIRSLAKLLVNYQKKYKLYTVRDILEYYAPTSENNTNAYIDHVCGLMGVAKDQYIYVGHRETMRKLVCAIIQHENGCNPYTYEIADGITLAGVGWHV